MMLWRETADEIAYCRETLTANSDLKTPEPVGFSRAGRRGHRRRYRKWFFADREAESPGVASYLNGIRDCYTVCFVCGCLWALQRE